MSQPSHKQIAVIVDDDYTSRTLIADYLEDEGYDVETFAVPEDITKRLCEINILIMDIRLSKERPYGGLDYINQQIKNGNIDFSKTKIVFISRWGKDREGVPQRLTQIREYEWLDVSTGLELTELREIIRRS